MTAAEVSLIIPTHNRRAAVLRALTAVAAQTFPLDKLDVVVVADGCVDDTAVALRTRPFPFRLTVLELPGRGPAAARNAGAAHATGSLLIFFDDDIEIVPGFVAAHVAAHQQHAHTVAIGHLPPAPLTHSGYYEQGLQQWWRHKFSRMRQPGYRFSYDDLFSGNFSVTAVLFTRVGGFDEALRCHEDYELGLRLITAGAAFVFAAEATGTHHDITDVNRSMLRRRAEGEADVYLLRRYPNLVQDLPIAQPEWTIVQRAMRLSAFRVPALGDLIARLQLACLSLLEKLWLRRLWQLLFAHLHDYWYWRGVAAAEPSPAAVVAFFQKETRPLPIHEMTLDLAQPLAAAVAELEECRPATLRLAFGDRWLGDVADAPGKERFHGGHLPRLLAEEFALPLLLARRGLPGALPPIPTAATDSRRAATPMDMTAPKQVVEVDVSHPLPALTAEDSHGLHLLVRAGQVPVGTVTLIDWPHLRHDEGALAAAIQSRLGWKLLAATLHAQISVELPPVSVVVCTRDRPAQLGRCLAALAALDYPQLEVVVVDNAPSSSETARLVAGTSARYVREDRPGLNWARNRGLTAASYDLVAFTDDDACPDSGWLRALAAAFAEPEVTAVTGSVLPLSLETRAQNQFEFLYGGMNHGFVRRVFRRAQMAAPDLLWASGYGVGANMAFRHSHLKAIGLFDVALDVGTPSGGGGDVEMFHRVVAQGGTLVYDPRALVWHAHRPEDADLEKLVQNNGRSFGCYLLTCARNRTVSRRAIAGFALRYWVWGWIGKRLLRPGGLPRHLVWQELVYALGSPWAYRRAQRQARLAAAQPAVAIRQVEQENV